MASSPRQALSFGLSLSCLELSCKSGVWWPCVLAGCYFDIVEKYLVFSDYSWICWNWVRETLWWQSLMQLVINNVYTHTSCVICSVLEDSGMVAVVFPHDESRQAAISFYINIKAKCIFLLYENFNGFSIGSFHLFWYFKIVMFGFTVL